MDFKALRAFVTVAEELNFTRAARRVNLTQQSLSEQMAKLEARIGVKLLERSTRNVALTDTGKTFLEDARAILRLTDEAVSRARGLPHARLEVSFTAPALHTVLPALQRAWAQRYPDVELSLVERCTRDGIGALLDGRADVAFVHLLAEDPRLETHHLLTDPPVLAVSHTHPLAARKRVTLEDLRDTALIVSPRSEAPRLRAYLDAQCRALGFDLHVVEELQPQSAQLARLVTRPDAATIIGSSLRALAPAGIGTIPLEGLDGLPLHAAIRNGERNPLTRAFWNLTREAAQQHPLEDAVTR
jgi:DNA-binding transcriptional LysR family regulator